MLVANREAEAVTTVGGVCEKWVSYLSQAHIPAPTAPKTPGLSPEISIADNPSFFTTTTTNNATAVVQSLPRFFEEDRRDRSFLFSGGLRSGFHGALFLPAER